MFAIFSNRCDWRASIPHVNFNEQHRYTHKLMEMQRTAAFGTASSYDRLFVSFRNHASDPRRHTQRLFAEKYMDGLPHIYPQQNTQRDNRVRMDARDTTETLPICNDVSSGVCMIRSDIARTAKVSSFPNLQRSAVKQNKL
jgi:hypothetical protein